MRVSILDDYFDTLRTLPCFGKLAEHQVTVWNDHVEDTDQLAERLRDTEQCKGREEEICSVPAVPARVRVRSLPEERVSPS